MIAAPRGERWRCFPFDPSAASGAPFSASHLVPGQAVGRFDLGDAPPVRYLAESAEHAVGEVLAHFRGTRFRASYLRVAGQPLALVRVVVRDTLLARVPDCTEAATLLTLDVKPSLLAHHDRRRTQAIARAVHRAGYAGLRWWSALTGAWHTTVLFTDAERAGDVRFAEPRVLHPDDEVVRHACERLGIRRD
ncbi:MAG: RES family NAD+ phosphorylase [Gemmatimonadaceae bacterium]|nr:RES family NAD+ phosphorylase [Gemmatimonadaceae bacterium]